MIAGEVVLERRDCAGVLMSTVAEQVVRNRLVVGTVVEAAVAKAKHIEVVGVLQS
jgi:hypothetical protein